ncbi:DUF72 domain-containing protein [Bradyrhizobium sp. 27S5]|uniref:DUF72 domain-containing protein n=1 Tax=Bradyrhizobium sp. 27S5 TaxID=3139728 RepID=UPI0030D04C9B
MHAARLKSETHTPRLPRPLKQSLYVGCSGWRYWKWRDSFYEGVPQNDWFELYLKRFDTVEINASFYSWPTCRRCPVLAPPARTEKVRLHRKGL